MAEVHGLVELDQPSLQKVALVLNDEFRGVWHIREPTEPVRAVR